MSLALAGAPDATADPPLHRVAILHGADLTLPLSALEDRIIREEVRDRVGPGVEFFSELMDAARMDDIDFEDELVALLARKFAARPTAVVVTCGEPALRFAIRHRDRIWPRNTIVSSCATDVEFDGTPLPAFVVPVNLRTDLGATLDLAATLQPAARRLYVVAGSTDFDRAWVGVARRMLATRGGRWSVVWATDLTMEQLLAQAQAWPRTESVLFLSMFRDAAGQGMAPREALERIAAASPAPVYGQFDTQLGHGLLGGAIASSERQAHQVGAIVSDLLLGRISSATAPRTLVQPRLTVDWGQLRRHRLDPDRIPPGVEVLERNPGLWEQYRWRLLGVATLMLLQLVLIAALLYERRWRRRHENELRLQRAEAAHGSRLMIVGELSASIAHEINQPLGAILANADAADMRLESDAIDVAQLREILADIRRDGLRASGVIEHVRALARKRAVTIREFDLNGMVADVLELLAPDAARRAVEVRVDLARDRPVARGDHVYLEQVLLNLALNAMDAMSGAAGKATRVLEVRTASTGNEVRVEVADNGPGIAAEHCARIFDSFQTTKAHGMGLGLSISRSIVLAHGGRIWVESEPGKGARFIFTVPPGRVARPAPATPAGEPA